MQNKKKEKKLIEATENIETLRRYNHLTRAITLLDNAIKLIEKNPAKGTPEQLQALKDKKKQLEELLGNYKPPMPPEIDDEGEGNPDDKSDKDNKGDKGDPNSNLSQNNKKNNKSNPDGLVGSGGDPAEPQKQKDKPINPDLGFDPFKKEPPILPPGQPPFIPTREDILKGIIERLSGLTGRAKEGAIKGLEDLLSQTASSQTEALDPAMQNPPYMDLDDDQFQEVIDGAYNLVDKVAHVHYSQDSAEVRKEVMPMLNNADTIRKITTEDHLAKQKEKTQRKARLQARAAENEKFNKRKDARNMLSILYFKPEFERAILDQVKKYEEDEEDPAMFNRQYDDDPLVVKPGETIEEYRKNLCPIINIFFDCSSSWRRKDLQAGIDIIVFLRDLEQQEKIKLNIYYFDDDVYPVSPVNLAELPACGSGCTEAWPRILETIKENKANNVLILTDADLGEQGETNHQEHITIAGGLWILWKNGENDLHILDNITALRGTYQYFLPTDGSVKPTWND